MHCTDSCTYGKRDGNNCVEYCPFERAYLNNGLCTFNCPSDKPYKENMNCVSTCSSGKIHLEYCVDSCPPELILKDGFCVASCTTGEIEFKGTCKRRIRYEGTSNYPGSPFQNTEIFMLSTFTTPTSINGFKLIITNENLSVSEPQVITIYKNINISIFPPSKNEDNKIYTKTITNNGLIILEDYLNLTGINNLFVTLSKNSFRLNNFISYV